MTRRYPERPIFGVGAIVFDGERVLLVKRAREPGQGRWSLPGGAQKVGETAEAALIREVAEETGLNVRPTRLFKLADIIEKDSEGKVAHHYTVADFLAEVAGGELRAGGDALAARWVRLAELKAYELTPLAQGAVEAAWNACQDT
ncbi:MAG TPA: NUDIX hydrolase [Sphingomonadales bacterium]|nr:NUDIX hydrolase [Sphingomonadales bacterium]